MNIHFMKMKSSPLPVLATIITITAIHDALLLKNLCKNRGPGHQGQRRTKADVSRYYPVGNEDHSQSSKSARNRHCISAHPGLEVALVSAELSAEYGVNSPLINSSQGRREVRAFLQHLISPPCCWHACATASVAAT